MQSDLEAAYPQYKIRILGVNVAGYETGNAYVTSERDIPWLQDGDENGDGKSDVWTSWSVIFRDVVILDGNNEKVGVFNLTDHTLTDPANYNALSQMLVDASMTSVPEPSSLILLLTTGIPTLLAHARRRRRT